MQVSYIHKPIDGSQHDCIVDAFDIFLSSSINKDWCSVAIRIYLCDMYGFVRESGWGRASKSRLGRTRWDARWCYRKGC
jgi:hypothetical protein